MPTFNLLNVHTHRLLNYMSGILTVKHTVSQQMDMSEFYLDKMAVYTRAGKHFSSFKSYSCKCSFLLGVLFSLLF